MHAIARAPALDIADSDSRSPEGCFEERLRQILRPGDRILDAGCGRGKFFPLTFAKRLGCHVTGVDICEDLALNPSLDARIRADLSSLPFQKESFDIVNCRLVVEHLRTPEIAFREFHRVLTPGGRLAIFTPNLLHYFGASAKATPQWFHAWFNSKIRGFAKGDTFPTHYRGNTMRRLKAQLSVAGFDRIEISMVEGNPSVLTFNSILYDIGTAYKNLVDRFPFLSGFRLNIIAITYKT
jgi:SAM-dependent methyltransferase